jgi:hypothetical protein
MLILHVYDALSLHDCYAFHTASAGVIQLTSENETLHKFLLNPTRL